MSSACAANVQCLQPCRAVLHCAVRCCALLFFITPRPTRCYSVCVCVCVCVCPHTHRHAYMHAIVHTHPAATVAVLQSYEAEGVGRVSTHPKLERWRLPSRVCVVDPEAIEGSFERRGTVQLSPKSCGGWA